MIDPGCEGRADKPRRAVVEDLLRAARLHRPLPDTGPEVARLEAERRQRRIAIHGAVERIHADFERADDAVETLTRLGVGLQELRKRAALVLRCQDCEGLPFAFVTYVDGRPLMGARQDRLGGVNGYLWLDGPFWGTYGWCKVRQWVLDTGDMREATPPPGVPQRTERLTHGEIVGAVP